MNKYLITGFSGFVSRHFLDYLESLGKRAEVLGLDSIAPAFTLDGYLNLICRFEPIDLLDKSKLDNIIYQFQPRYILHLASFSSVAYSWKDPIASFRNNTNIFLNLLEKIRGLGLECRVLSIGSSEEYGNVSPDEVPLGEDHPLGPVSPYAVARVAQEMLSKVYAEGYGLDIVMTRSFNHVGPRQREVFAVSSFAKQMVESRKRGEKQCRLTVGDVSVVRDFLDVRDVVRAYHGLMEGGRRGEVYNICSGEGTSLREIIDILSSITGMAVTLNIDNRLFRPSDNRVIVGRREKIEKEIGWYPRITVDESLRALVDYWDSVL